MIGRLSEEKGFDLLIDAACRLLNEGAQIGLVIDGEGPIRKQLETQIAESGFSEHLPTGWMLAKYAAFHESLDMFRHVIVEQSLRGASTSAAGVNGTLRC